MLNTKIDLAVDAHGMLLGVFIKDASTTDCQKASCLIEGIDAGSLLAERAYDTNKITERAK